MGRRPGAHLSAVRTLLAPRWLALHLVVLVVLAACGTLGWWQFEAYERERADAAGTVTLGEPVAIRDAAAPGQALGLDDPVAVRATGTYDGDAQLVVPGRAMGGRTGLLLVTPLRLSDGGVVPVLRGWVPSPDSAAAAVPEGPVEVVGLLQPNEADAGRRSDASTAAGKEISAVSTTELLRRLPQSPAELYDGHLLLTAQTPPAAAAPELVPPRERSPGALHGWRNLSYAAQWWLFGLLAVAWWATAVRDVLRRRSAAPRG